MIRFKQKEYSWISNKLKSFLGFTDEYLTRKLHQLQDSKIMARFRKIYPKSYNKLRQIKSTIKL